MADLTITAAQVIPGTGARLAIAQAGEALTAGQSVYRKADGKMWKADADAVLTAAAKGITIGSAAAESDVIYQWHGPLTLGAGAAPAQGAVYCVSATAGGIAPEGDIASGKYVTILGVGTTNNQILVHVYASGVAHV